MNTNRKRRSFRKAYSFLSKTFLPPCTKKLRERKQSSYEYITLGNLPERRERRRRTSLHFFYWFGRCAQKIQILNAFPHKTSCYIIKSTRKNRHGTQKIILVDTHTLAFVFQLVFQKKGKKSTHFLFCSCYLFNAHRAMHNSH